MKFCMQGYIVALQIVVHAIMDSIMCFIIFLGLELQSFLQKTTTI